MVTFQVVERFHWIFFSPSKFSPHEFIEATKGSFFRLPDVIWDWCRWVQLYTTLQHVQTTHNSPIVLWYGLCAVMWCYIVWCACCAVQCVVLVIGAARFNQTTLQHVQLYTTLRHVQTTHNALFTDCVVLCIPCCVVMLCSVMCMLCCAVCCVSDWCRWVQMDNMNKQFTMHHSQIEVGQHP